MPRPSHALPSRDTATLFAAPEAAGYSPEAAFRASLDALPGVHAPRGLDDWVGELLERFFETRERGTLGEAVTWPDGALPGRR